MYIHNTVGVFFFAFILFVHSVHCDNVANNNEIIKICIPSAPQNLRAYNVTSNEVRLSWSAPLTFTRRTIPNSQKRQNDFENRSINRYENNKQKYGDGLSSVLIDNYDALDTYQHHGTKLEGSEAQPTVQEAVVEKSYNQSKPKDFEVFYVLSYEQGVPRYPENIINSNQASDEVKKMNVFPSDLSMEDNSRATKNLTLINTSGRMAKRVGFRLRNLKPFTPYKIWVRAYCNFTLDGVTSSYFLDSLGSEADLLYVLTDVAPPSVPLIQSMSCDQAKSTLYLQWRQPLQYNNSLYQYVVTLRKIPEKQPRMRLTVPTKKNDTETTIPIEVNLQNGTSYEVKLYAVTQSVARKNALIDGDVNSAMVSSAWCAAQWEDMSPTDVPVSLLKHTD